MAQERRLARQNDEHRLRDFLRRGFVAELSARRSVNERRVPLHQGGESLFGAAPDIFTEQLLIAAFVHFTGIAAARGRNPKTFSVNLNSLRQKRLDWSRRLGQGWADEVHDRVWPRRSEPRWHQDHDGNYFGEPQT